MTEYIEREAVKRLAYRPRMFDEIAVVSVDSIDRIPAADVVEVVRCKDCAISHEKDMFGQRTILACRRTCLSVKPDGFCSEGIRREIGGQSDA